MGNKLRVEDIIKKFGYNNTFTSKELLEFYKIQEMDLKEVTFRWRIYVLKKEGVISNVKRGVYILKDKKKFNPNITKKIKSLYNVVVKQYPYIEVCIWDTSWYDNFMNHQVYNSYIIIEVDRDAMNSVFSMLKGKKDKVYLNPNKREVENYLLSENAIIVKHKIKESPTQLNGNVIVSKIEKLLVDLYCEKYLLISYQGREMKNIFERAFEEYEINLTTLYRYARNRGIRDRIETYIQEEIQIALNYNKEHI